MLAEPDAQRLRGQLLVFWILWGSILAGLCVIYLVLGRGPIKPGPTPNLAGVLIAMAPLFVSIVIRWLVLPRATRPGPLMVMFIAGLGLAEACGLIGIFIGAAYRDSLFVLGLLGVVSYVPIFVKRQLEPKPRGFVPNN
ncbi:MAG TPA: hypothetical protein VG734_14895 [Lacunisphaera sp.]|nr:hypothetical protein [Lacunisphaera sp.]